MRGAFFIETLRQNWLSTLGWGIALGALGLLVLTFVPDMEVLQRYGELLKTLPAGLLQAFGFNPQEQLTPEAFLESFLFARFILFIAIFGVICGLAVTTNEEDNGIMEVVLSLPVSRARLMLERFGAFALLTVILALLMFGGLWIGAQMVSIPLNITRVLEGTLVLIPVIYVVIGITMLMGAVIRRKTAVIAVVAGIVVSSYFLDALGAAVANDTLKALRGFSFFSYADINNVLIYGTNWGNIVVLLGLTALLVGSAILVWQRRDIG